MQRRLKNQEFFQTLETVSAVSCRGAAYVLAAAHRVNNIPKFSSVQFRKTRELSRTKRSKRPGGAPFVSVCR